MSTLNDKSYRDSVARDLAPNLGINFNSHILQIYL